MRSRTLASLESCCRWLLCVVHIPSSGIERRLIPNSSHKSGQCPDGSEKEEVRDLPSPDSCLYSAPFFEYHTILFEIEKHHIHFLRRCEDSGPDARFPALVKARKRLGNGTTSPPQIEMRSQRYSNAASGPSRVCDRGIDRAEPHYFNKGVVLHS